ncbi:MAG: TlpA family protein disulfide reductase [Candidatus Latescibacteria bacterium]|nr:TlpA family protein disulfide reductase [Candidatus Latescibacterota bacterium]
MTNEVSLNIFSVHLTKPLFQTTIKEPEMAALEAGVASPEFTLTDLDGSVRNKEDLHRNGLMFAAFYKVGCGTCQFTAPYLEKFYQAYQDREGFQFWGISQDSVDDTNSFMNEYGGTFPNLIDETHWASADYGLTNVPAMFLVDESGLIKESCVGFSRDDLNRMSHLVANHLGVEPEVISDANDGAPSLKPG